MTTSTAVPVLNRAALYRVWVRTVTVAEFLGFVVPACAGALLADADAAVALPVILAAGAVEGAVLGAGQAAVLRWALPRFPWRRWVAVTAGAAVVAYLIGMSPSTFAGVWQSWPVAVTAPLALILGVALLCSIGFAQWTVLRRLTAHAGWWITVSAVAWLAGLAVFLLVTMPLWHPGQALILIIAIGTAGGLAMAATMAAVTGVAVRRLLP
ncbi:hypothetical protein ACPCHT_21250 [Nucisporomicrobium flavum]|uniref:hypothetical protein n=1 Tax=Nucisporomicrobium flavum TaxID=2785915 RepID=UPI003C2E89A1